MAAKFCTFGRKWEVATNSLVSPREDHPYKRPLTREFYFQRNISEIKSQLALYEQKKITNFLQCIFWLYTRRILGCLCRTLNKRRHTEPHEASKDQKRSLRLYPSRLIFFLVHTLAQHLLYISVFPFCRVTNFLAEKN